jgi:hypothetical protein
MPERTLTSTEREIMREYGTAKTDKNRSQVYKPGIAMMWEATPQTNPYLFTDDEIRAEIKYLIRLDRRFGPHHLRTMAYTRLMKVLSERAET